MENPARIWRKNKGRTCGLQISIGNVAKSQSRQSAKLFLKSSELGLPHPLTRRLVCLPPMVRGEGHTRLGGQGRGGVQFRRGDIHCGTLGTYVLYEPNHFWWLVLTVRLDTYLFLPQNCPHISSARPHPKKKNRVYISSINTVYNYTCILHTSSEPPPPGSWIPSGVLPTR